MINGGTRSDLMVETTTDRRPEIPLRESPLRWVLLTLLFTGLLFGYAQRGAFSVAAPFLSEELRLSKAGMGVLLSAFFWVYSFMQMPAGWMVDRFGVRRAYSYSFVFWSLATALSALATNFAAMFGFRVALGLGQAVQFPATARAVANWFPDRERGTATAIYLTGVRLGTAVISWVGAYILVRYGWKFFFVATGLLPLLWLIPWTKFLTRWERDSPFGPRVTGAGARAPSFRSSLLLFKQRTVLGIFLGYFAYDYAWFVFITWLPGYLILERKFTPGEMGVYSSVPYLAMSVVIVTSGLVSDWLVRRGGDEVKIRKALITVGLSIGCFILPAGLVADKITAVWLLTISLCGLGVCSPNTWTLTQAVCDKKIVGVVSGIQNFGGNLGGIIAPALTGYIAHVTNSFALALGLTAGVLVAGIAAYWLLVRGKVEISASP